MEPMEEQEEESPSVATQTESTAICHQGTSVNAFMIATNRAVLTTDRIRVKCHTVLYGRASRYVPAPSDHEHQPGEYTQTPRKNGEAKMTQLPDVNPHNNCQSNRATARHMNNCSDNGVKISKNAKRKAKRKMRIRILRKLAHIQRIIDRTHIVEL